MSVQRRGPARPLPEATERAYGRFVALGDSQTEGLNDGDPLSGYRGWADRLAEHLTLANPDLRYANLAVRGRLAGQVRAEQLGAACAMRPDLAIVFAGMNDLLRRRFDSKAVAGELEHMFAALAATGAQVGTVTFPDIGRIVPFARQLRPRVLDLNDRIRAAAGRHGVVVFDSYPHEVTTDSRMWSHDRIHASPLGHALIAAAMAHALGLPGSDDNWTRALPARPEATRWEVVRGETRWAAGVLAPWIVRRARGLSSGDGRSAKRPELLPLAPGSRPFPL